MANSLPVFKSTCPQISLPELGELDISDKGKWASKSILLQSNTSALPLTHASFDWLWLN